MSIPIWEALLLMGVKHNPRIVADFEGTGKLNPHSGSHKTSERDNVYFFQNHPTSLNQRLLGITGSKNSPMMNYIYLDIFLPYAIYSKDRKILKWDKK